MNPVKDRFYYVYVLQSLKNNYWYTGFTDDLRKRFKKHQEEKSTYTIPIQKEETLLSWYTMKHHLERRTWIAREKYLKSGMGKRYLKNRLKRSLSLTG